jgi:hypothetical protein
MVCDTTSTVDGLPVSALRGPVPRVYRNYQRDTATLLARSARRRQQYTEVLPDDPEVFGITYAGRDL